MLIFSLTETHILSATANTYDRSSSNWLRHSYRPAHCSAVDSGCCYSFPVDTADYTADEAVDCMAAVHCSPAVADNAEVPRPDWLAACSGCMAGFV